jgi:hypothetical protein
MGIKRSTDSDQLDGWMEHAAIASTIEELRQSTGL